MENKELRDKIVDKEIIIQRLSDKVKGLKRNHDWEATSYEIIKDMQVNSDIPQISTPVHANTKIKETFVTNQNSLVKCVKAQGRKKIPSKVLQSPYTKISCKTKGKTIYENPEIQSRIENSDEYMLSQEEVNAITTLKAQNKIKDQIFGPLLVERRSLESLLNPMKWVDDDVISKYTELMAIRENSGRHNLLKCHFFNAWFHKYVCTTRIITKGDKKFEEIYYDGNDAKIESIIRRIPYELKSKEKLMIPLNDLWRHFI
ncbi:uncharacterized protein LOC131218170 [Magnolia sinica]|uniref:uncharacterized protein LOC131218170 n=1 Tax=Magnolia sinica TaxID=86752 RepID=UPI0026588165|nr:uncharacterized protein LOC131218170 [Magnolia sinica]